MRAEVKTVKHNPRIEARRPSILDHPLLRDLEMPPAGELNTAGHEMNHALIGELAGAKVAYVSVEPEGNSLGRTVIHGRITSDLFKLMAIGGAIDPPFDKASGYGSDLLKFSAHDDLFWYKTRAEKILNTYTPQVRLLAAMMLHRLKVIPGSMVISLHELAKKALDKSDLGRLFEEADQMNLLTHKVDEINGDYTVISTFAEETTYEIFDESKKLIESQSICLRCGGINGNHRIECKNYSLPIYINPTEKTPNKPLTMPDRLRRPLISGNDGPGFTGQTLIHPKPARRIDPVSYKGRIHFQDTRRNLT